MKKVCLIGCLTVFLVMIGSCDNDPSPVVTTDPAELMGTWVRTFPNRVGGATSDSPVIERGETHIIITFKDNGEFVYNRTTLGIYAGTSPKDTSSIRIESGNYLADDGNIDVVLDRLIWWDSFYTDMEGFEEAPVIPNRLKFVTFKIVDGELNLVYFISTDAISEDQVIPGLNKFDYNYTRR